MKIQFSTSGAAFRDGYADKDVIPFYERQEAARILKVIAMKLEDGYKYGPIMDINGNKIGEWSI